MALHPPLHATNPQGLNLGRGRFINPYSSRNDPVDAGIVLRARAIERVGLRWTTFASARRA